MREKCLYSKLFWSIFSRIRTEYEEILRLSPYSVRMRENMDQNNFEYGQFLRSEGVLESTCSLRASGIILQDVFQRFQFRRVAGQKVC